MAEDTICGACNGEWPCACSPQAVPVTLMDTASDLAYRMGEGRNDPLTVDPFDPDPPIDVQRYKEGHCGHYGDRFNLDPDKRVVTCRGCEAVLDPYDVLAKLAGMLAQYGFRLKAAQELERREAARDGERKARAAVRRHRYAPYAYKRGAVHCATCGGEKGGAIHTSAADD